MTSIEKEKSMGRAAFRKAILVGAIALVTVSMHGCNFSLRSSSSAGESTETVRSDRKEKSNGQSAEALLASKTKTAPKQQKGGPMKQAQQAPVNVHKAAGPVEQKQGLEAHIKATKPAQQAEVTKPDHKALEAEILAEFDQWLANVKVSLIDRKNTARYWAMDGSTHPTLRSQMAERLKEFEEQNQGDGDADNGQELEDDDPMFAQLQRKIRQFGELVAPKQQNPMSECSVAQATRIPKFNVGDKVRLLGLEISGNQEATVRDVTFSHSAQDGEVTGIQYHLIMPDGTKVELPEGNLALAPGQEQGGKASKTKTAPKQQKGGPMEHLLRNQQNPQWLEKMADPRIQQLEIEILHLFDTWFLFAEQKMVPHHCAKMTSLPWVAKIAHPRLRGPVKERCDMFEEYKSEYEKTVPPNSNFNAEDIQKWHQQNDVKAKLAEYQKLLSAPQVQ